MEQQLLDAIRDLNEAIRDLSAGVGRGTRPSTAGKTGGVNRNTNNPLDDAAKNLGGQAKKMSKILGDTANDLKSQGRRQTVYHDRLIDNLESNTKALSQNEKALARATESTKELYYANRSATRGALAFGRSLLNGSGSVKDLSNSMGMFGGTLTEAGRAGNRLAGVLGGLAGGLAFALSTMDAFADDARNVATSVDLGAVNAGFITTQKLFSGLGKSFDKVLNESANSFKIFGGTTEEAIKNLSALSNGLRTGSVSTAMTNRLGKDSAKQMKLAAAATANLGLTQDEQASLQASIMTQVRLTAKNEVDAQKMLVKQYSETVVSARNLSNSFGIGAKEILKAIENFNKSTSGKTTQRLGVKGATDALAMLQSMNLGLSEEQMQKMAVDIARGRTGDAATMVADDPNAYNAVIALGESFKEAQANGGVNDKTLREAMLRRREQVMGGAIGAGADGTGLGLTTGGKMAESYENINDYFRRLAEGGKKAEDDKKKKEEQGRTTEEKNILTMNQLTAALDTLKGAVSTLTSTLLAVLGPLGLIAASMVAGLLANKLMGKLLGDSVGKAVGGVFDKIKFGQIGTTISEGFGKIKFGGFPTASGTAGSMFSGIGTMLTDTVLPALGRFGSSLWSFATSIPGMLKNLGGSLMSFVKNLGSGLGPTALRGLGIGGIGALGGMAASWLGEKATEAGHTKTGAALDILGSTATMAGTGAMIGSIIPGLGTAVGAAVGGALGLGKGLWDSGKALFGATPTTNTTAAANSVQTGLQGATATGPGLTTGGMTGPSDPLASADQHTRQIIQYLSAITVDIAAIRGNTRPDNSAIAPVRLG